MHVSPLQVSTKPPTAREAVVSTMHVSPLQLDTVFAQCSCPSVTPKAALESHWPSTRRQLSAYHGHHELVQVARGLPPLPPSRCGRNTSVCSSASAPSSRGGTVGKYPEMAKSKKTAPPKPPRKLLQMRRTKTADGEVGRILPGSSTSAKGSVTPGSGHQGLDMDSSYEGSQIQGTLKSSEKAVSDTECSRMWAREMDSSQQSSSVHNGSHEKASCRRMKRKKSRVEELHDMRRRWQNQNKVIENWCASSAGQKAGCRPRPPEKIVYTEEETDGQPSD